MTNLFIFILFGWALVVGTAARAQPIDTATWRGTGTGSSSTSKSAACEAAKEDGSVAAVSMIFRLTNGFHRVVKSDTMSDCTCTTSVGPFTHTCTVNVSVTHSNK